MDSNGCARKFGTAQGRSGDDSADEPGDDRSDNSAAHANDSSPLAWPQSERPRERLLELGASVLSDGEILALILGTGHRRAGSALAVARCLLASFVDLRGVVGAPIAELAGVAGVGRARAAKLHAIAELARRLHVERLDPGIVLSSSSAVYAHFGPLLADEKRESFYGVLLDGKNRVMSKVRISQGSLGASLVHPREAFRPAVREAAAAILFVHNHPSGDPTPSAEDRRITERLRRAGEVMGISVLDHVVVGRGKFWSFADNGW
ncbi:MAG: DNA repair protein RadC [Deltaproteobacteria bacterium]|nr:DNA repair protein RadC [Deltaproteobacteria bacterium]